MNHFRKSCWTQLLGKVELLAEDPSWWFSCGTLEHLTLHPQNIELGVELLDDDISLKFAKQPWNHRSNHRQVKASGKNIVLFFWKHNLLNLWIFSQVGFGFRSVVQAQILESFSNSLSGEWFCCYELPFGPRFRDYKNRPEPSQVLDIPVVGLNLPSQEARVELLPFRCLVPQWKPGLKFHFSPQKWQILNIFWCGNQALLMVNWFVVGKWC